MEVFVPCNTSTSLDISSSSGSSTDPHHPTQHNSEDLSMNDLKTCLTVILNSEDVRTSTNGLTLSPGENDIGDVMKGHEYKGLDKDIEGLLASEKCLSKCATFPPPDEPKYSGSVLIGEEGKQEEDITAEIAEINNDSESVNKCYSRSVSLPVPLKPVPAMKGNREKLGIPPKKLSVTWAPDVYDPIPTSVSHVPSNKSQNYRSNGKKSGKYKQRSGGKSSRSSKGKDKKQVRKNSGGPIKPKPFHEESGVGFGEPIEFDVGSPDPFCGSSFLKKNVTKLHFPVAEAT